MDFYDNCLDNVHRFAHNKSDIEKSDLYVYLKQILGHEVIGLLQNTRRDVSMTDIQTDLKFFFDKIKAHEESLKTKE